MDRNLQSMIQVLIGIVFRSIRRQEEHLNFILVLFQPSRSKLAMMDLQIVQNQEHFPLRSADQTLHEADQPLLVHGVRIEHKTNLALAADCRDHIDPLSFGFHRQHRRTAFRRKAALYDFTVAYAGLICPIDVRILCFRTPCNSGIFLTFPPLDTRRILFSGTLRRTLAAHAPALHVVRQCPLIYAFVELFLDVLPCPSQRPQFAGEPEILRPFLLDRLSDIFLFFLGYYLREKY